MSLIVLKSLVIVLIFIFDFFLFQNVFFITSVQALDEGFKIESLKSEQNNVNGRTGGVGQGNDAEPKFFRNLDLDHINKSGENYVKDLKEPKNLVLENFSNTGATELRLNELSAKGIKEAGPDSQESQSSKGKISSATNKSQPKTSEHSQDKPNIITSTAEALEELNEQQLLELRINQRRSKDTLVLKYTEEDPSFSWGDENVQEWQHLRFDGQDFYIGRRWQELFIVLREQDKKDTIRILNVSYAITALETYSYWNFEQARQEAIILISSNENILWYRKHSEIEEFEFFGNWTLDRFINQITYFSMESQEYLLVCYNQSSVDIYNFNIQSEQVNLIQTLPLEKPCKEVSLLKTEKELILAVPQSNKAVIYSFNSQNSNQFKFHLKEELQSQGLLSTKAFRISGKSYLALAGNNSRILLYQGGKFTTKTIFDNSFGVVEQFLPLPIRTYRDDLILLLQKRVSFNQTSVKFLIWNGDSFEISLPVRCRTKSQILPIGTCLYNLNLKGAPMSSRREAVSLILPQPTGKSHLYHFHFEIMPKNFAFQELQEAFDIIKALAKERDDLVKQALEFLNTPEELLLHRMLNDISTVDFLQTPEFEFDGEVEEIFLNNYKWSPEDSEVDLNVLIENLEDLEKSFFSGRLRRELDEDALIYEDLSFDSVFAEELEIENLNGQSFYIKNGVLDFPGEIIVSELEVLEKVEEPHKRQAADQEVEDLELEGDLEFDFINGLKWEDLKKHIVFKNRPEVLETLKVEGDVIVEDILNIKSLNSLAFPDDYLVSKGPRSSIVRAKKYFNNTLVANSVDTEGLINGQNPVEAITLRDQQDWLGSAIFNHLEVSEILELNGTAHGRNVANFPSNPTLQESNIIEADCVFNDLQVNGPIVIKGDLDGRPLGDLLKEIVQKPEDPSEDIVIESRKSFSLVVFPIDFELENNTINKIATEKFLTVHTQQTLDLNSLEGYVYFYNLTLKGLYDGIKIEDVVREVISLDKPLDLSTTQLIFEEELQAENLIILDKINDLPIRNNLQTLYEDLHLETAEFEHLEANTIELSQDIVGPGKLNNIELHNFVKERSWHEPPVQGNLFLNELYASQGLKADELHGINAEYLLDFLEKIEELPEMVLNGQIQVDHITVTGDVQVHKVNGLLFDEDIQMTSIWLNRPNHLTTSLTFKNPVEVRGNILVKGNYQGLHMPDFMEDIVLRTNTNASLTIIKAPKSFLKPVYVLQNSQTEALNGIAFENIALKTKQNIFQGSVKIQGKLTSPELMVQGLVNDNSLKDLENLLYYDNQRQYFVLKGQIEFENPISVDDLTVLGDFQELKNLSDFFDHLIFKSYQCHLEGQNNFTGRVSIEQGAYIHELNGLDVESLFQKIIFIHGQEPVIITSNIVFEDPVKVQQISEHKSLKTQKLNGCLLTDWLNDTLRVDQDQYIPHYLQFSAGALDVNSLNIHFINDLDLSRLVTLNTPQDFNETIAFSDVYLQDFIEANNSVNGLDLEEEYNNTLMIYGGQHITTPLTIQSIQVLQNLQVLGIVNGNKDLSDVATLEDNLELQSPVYFQSLYSPQVQTNDLVTGIDLDKWFQTSLKALGAPTMQYITGNWSARSLKVKQGAQDFQYSINGFDPWQYNAFIRNPRSYNDKERKELCEMLKEIWKKIEEKSIIIKYLEESFVRDLENRTKTSKNFMEDQKKKIFHLKHDQDNFLLLNAGCTSHFYKWLAKQKNFKYLHSYESGPITQVMVVASRNSSTLQFITNYESTEPLNCSSFKGVNMWTSKPNATISERGYSGDIFDISRTNNSESSILILTKDLVRELDLETFETLRKWKIYFKERSKNQSYRFVSSDNPREEILVTNGREIASLNNPKNRKFKKELSDFSFPIYVQLPSWLGFQEFETISLLKPNASMARKFAFSDFKQVLERILLELSEKLNQQINITQLSIPESDLFDEYLIPDFVAIMEQLQVQKIYNLTINFEEISLPETPSQVLAAHVLQIVWPAVEEIEEIHGYLKDNETHNHPLCRNITNSLASLITEVLAAANPRNRSEHSQELFHVIECVRKFDKMLSKYIGILNNKSGEVGDLNPEASASIKNERIIPLNYQEDLTKKEEILSLKVGSLNNPRHLVAVSKTLTPGLDSSIHLYGGEFKGNPYQIIKAQNPRSLIELRLKQKTLLMFIENCCQVQVWRYQGLSGFVKFASFRQDSEVQQILTMALPNEEGNFKYYLVLLTLQKLKFYEISAVGISQAPPPLPCN